MVQSARLSRIVDEQGEPFALPPSGRVKASHFDLVNRWDDTDHWTFASNASGDTTNIRQDRNRATAACRFEVDNNPYAKAMMLKIGNEVIQNGPALEITPLTISRETQRAARQLEKRWSEWADETNFRTRLVMNVTEPITAGECYNVFRSNYGLETVQVDFEQYEGIQFGTPYGSYTRWRDGQSYPYVDGMQLDRNGNVSEYHKLKYHPGSRYQSGVAAYNDYDTISPSVCCHIFRKERPSQYRGIAQMLPCVELFAKLRRYTDAVIETAENAASILGTIETRFGPDQCPAEGPDSAMRLRIGSAMFMNLPEGWSANPFKGEQPTTTYSEFKNAILHEIMSCLLLPWNLASGDSSDYNFSSARMDHLIFDRVVSIIRKDLERRLINRFFRFWFEFAMFTPGVVPSRLGAFDFKWYWGKRVAVDPVKQANANKILKEAGLLDEADYWQQEGMSQQEAAEKRIRQRLWEEKREMELRKEMGLPERSVFDDRDDSDRKQRQRRSTNEVEVEEPVLA